MAKTIANLNIQLSASSANLKKDLDTASRAVTGFARQTERNAASMRVAGQAGGMFGKGMGSVGGMAIKATAGLAAMAAAAVVAAVGVGAMAGQLQEIDRIADVSERIGETTENLIRLQYAASLSGSDVESLNTALQKQTRTIGEALQGNKEAAAGFERLGLSAENLARKSPAEAFAIISDRIRDLPNPTARAASAVDVFGKSGIDLINVLQLGSDGLRELGDEAEALGLTLNDIDKEKNKAAADAIDRAKSALTGVARQLAVAFSPAIELVADRVADFFGQFARSVRNLQPLIEELGYGLADNATSLLTLLTEGYAEFNKWIESLGDVRETLASIGQRISSVLSHMIKVVAVAKEFAKAIRGDPTADVWAAIQKQTDDFWKADGSRWKDRHRNAEKAAEASAALAKGSGELQENLAKAAEEAKHWQQIADQLNSKFDPRVDFAKAIEQANEAAARGLVSQEVWNAAIGDATKKYREALEAADKLREATHVGAARRGTREGIDAIAKAQDTMRRQMDQRKRTAEAEKLRDELLKKSNEHLKDIRDAVKAGPPIKEHKI